MEIQENLSYRSLRMLLYMSQMNSDERKAAFI